MPATYPTLEQHLMDKLEILLRADDPTCYLRGSYEVQEHPEHIEMSISQREIRAMYDGLLMLRDYREPTPLPGEPVATLRQDTVGEESK